MSVRKLPAIRPPANATEERLMDAALTLFAEKGYEATSVREIIEAVGVTRPVLYYYCSSKEDLFKRLIHWKQNGAYQELERLIKNRQGCVARIRAVVRGSFAVCVADPRTARLIFQTHFGPAIPGVTDFLNALTQKRFLLIQQIIQEGLDTGELAGSDAAALALVLCCLMDHSIHVFIRTAKPEVCMTPEWADALVDVFLNGVGAGRRKPVVLPPLRS